jgi:hypothetical protein
MQQNLFGEPLNAKEPMFGGKLLSDAILYISNVKNQDAARFRKIKSEMYAWSIKENNREMFDFLEARFGTVELPDKEVHLHLQVVNGREEAAQCT